jgi:hypothetical protein
MSVHERATVGRFEREMSLVIPGASSNPKRFGSELPVRFLATPATSLWA